MVDSLTPLQRNAIRKAMDKGRFNGINAAIDVMGCSVHDAEDIVHVLGNSNTTETRIIWFFIRLPYQSWCGIVTRFRHTFHGARKKIVKPEMKQD